MRSPGWRPVRWGLVALVAAQVLGLNLWAWHQQRQIEGRRLAINELLRTTHPQVRAILDAPVQMQRETDALRSAAGRPGEADLEAALGAIAAVWPAGQPPLQNLRFENSRLSFAASGWPETQVAAMRAQLATSGWELSVTNGVLSLSRARGA